MKTAKSHISFTNVLNSKRQGQKSQPKLHHLPVPRHHQDEPQPTQEWASLSEIMQAYDQDPNVQYTLFLNMSKCTKFSYRSSVFDSKDSKSKGSAFGNFQSWIQKQARQQNKQNIADVQPRIREQPPNSKRNTSIQGKNVISNKTKIGMGHLCEMYKQNEIQNGEPVWKCQPSNSLQSQSQFASEIYSETSRGSQGKSSNSSNSHFNVESLKQSQNFNAARPNSIIRNSNSKQSLNLMFNRLRNDKLEQLEENNVIKNIISERVPVDQPNQSSTQSRKNLIQGSKESIKKIIRDKEEIKEQTIRQIQNLAESIKEKWSQYEDNENQQMLLGQQSSQNSSPEPSEQKINQVRQELTEILKLKNNDNSRKRDNFINQPSQTHGKRNQCRVNEEPDQPYFKNQNLSREGSSKQQKTKESLTSKSIKNNQLQVGYSFAENFQIKNSIHCNKSISGQNKVQSSFSSNSINNSNNAKFSNQKPEDQEDERQRQQNQNMRNFRKYVQSSNSKIPKIESVQFNHTSAFGAHQKQEIPELPVMAQRESEQYPQNDSPVEDTKLSTKKSLSHFLPKQSIRSINVKDSCDRGISDSMTQSREQFIVENSIPIQIKRSAIVEDDSVVQDQQQSQPEAIQMQDQSTRKVEFQVIKQSTPREQLSQQIQEVRMQSSIFVESENCTEEKDNSQRKSSIFDKANLQKDVNQYNMNSSIFAEQSSEPQIKKEESLDRKDSRMQEIQEYILSPKHQAVKKNSITEISQEVKQVKTSVGMQDKQNVPLINVSIDAKMIPKSPETRKNSGVSNSIETILIPKSPEIKNSTQTIPICKSPELKSSIKAPIIPRSPEVIKSIEVYKSIPKEFVHSKTEEKQVSIERESVKKSIKKITEQDSELNLSLKFDGLMSSLKKAPMQNVQIKKQPPVSKQAPLLVSNRASLTKPPSLNKSFTNRNSIKNSIAMKNSVKKTETEEDFAFQLQLELE